MHNLYEDLTDVCEMLSEELKKANDKLAKNGNGMTSSDLDYIDKLTHAIKSVKTTKAMLESEDGYSSRGRSMNMGSSNMYMPRYAYDDMSYARGRDSMGRYTSRDSGYSGMNDAIMELREAMNKATDESSRMKIKQLIDEMERM